MTLNEFMEFVGALKMAYDEPWFLSDERKIEFWFQALQDIPFEVAKAVAVKCATTREDPPKIATIRQMAVEVTAPPEDTLGELEAWALVQKAIRNGTYGAEREFEELPPIVQKAVGDPSNIREWAQAEDDAKTVIQSQFQRAYRTAMQRSKEEAQMPALQTLQALGETQVERIGVQ